MLTHYILQIVLFQTIFLIAYDLFHKKDTFFAVNRVYLLLGAMLPLILPFIKFQSIQQRVPTINITKITSNFLNVPSNESNTEQIMNQVTNNVVLDINNINWFLLIYSIGVIICVGYLLSRFFSIYSIHKKTIKKTIEGYNIRIVADSKLAFSFWNTIYIGDQLSYNDTKQIFAHEVVHVQQKHSMDLLIFEFLKIFLWFNPLVYIYQSRIVLIHEYIADQESIKLINKKKYLEQLLNYSFHSEKITFINQFFNQSLIKKRILMLQKSKSNSVHKLKYLLLIPLLCVIFVYTSCNEESVFNLDKNNNQKTYLKKVNIKIEPTCLNKESKYDETLDNYLKIKNGKNSEVIVRLATVETSEVIRTIHLKREQEYKIKYIPEGKYRVNVTHGNDYIEVPTGNQCDGMFKNQIIAEIGEDILDFSVIETEDGKNVPSYALSVDLSGKGAKDDKNPNGFDLESAEDKVRKTSSNSEIPCGKKKGGVYDYRLDNYLKITNGKNAEVIVTITSIETSKSVRTIYLKRNVEYYVRNIPEGIYRLFIKYGDDIDTITENGVCVPYFKTNPIFEKGEDELDFNTITTEDGKNVPSYSITLDVVDSDKK